MYTEVLFQVLHRRALKMKSAMASYHKVTMNDQLRSSSKVILLQLHKKLWRTQHRPFYCHSAFEANWKVEKGQLSEHLMSWLQIKTTVALICHLLLFYTTTMNYFSIGLWCTTESGLHTKTSNHQLSGWTKKQLQGTSQRQICTKTEKGHCHFLVVCCPSDPLQLSESQQNHYT